MFSALTPDTRCLTLLMARRKSKPKKVDHSQRMNRLKAKALTKVAGQVWGYNERHRSIVLLSEALRRDPNNPEILVNLATALGKQRHYEKAESLLVRLLELAPGKASIHRRVAQTYAAIDRPERAVEYYRRSLELNSDTSVTVPTFLELAGLYERRHQLDDAQSAVQEALRANRPMKRRCCRRPYWIAARATWRRPNLLSAPWQPTRPIPGKHARRLRMN